MINPISGAAQVAAPVPATASSAAPAPQSAPTPVADTVQISSTALAAQAAMQEATESPAVTAQEARGGDHQAQRLLAKEAAAK